MKASFFTTSLTLHKSTEVVSNLSISNLSISDFKEAKSAFLAKCYVSAAVAFLNLLLSYN